MELQFKFDYFLLMAFMFSSFYWLGVMAEKKHNINTLKYWEYAIFPILLFVFIEGSRFGRGTDYLWYQTQFYAIKHPIEEQEPLFMFLYNLFYDLDFQFHNVIRVFSFIWIFSIVYVAKFYVNVIRYGIVFYLIACLILYESAIRQCLGVSFIIWGIPFLLQKRYVAWGILVCLALFIHTSSVVYAVFFTILVLWNRTINVSLILCLYLFFVFIWDFSKIDILSQIFSLLDLGDNKMQSYINNSETWFSSQAVQQDTVRSFPVKIMSALLDGSLIYYGHRLNCIIENKKKYIFVYNVFIIGVIGMMSAYPFEIVRRIFQPMYFFWGIVAAYCVTYKTFLIRSRFDAALFMMIKLLILVLFVKNILLSHAGQLFIWDVSFNKL